jgi:chemosensory pili system protein ChpC
MADKEIRTIVAPLKTCNVLLPNSAVAEILSYSTPEPLKKAPAWVLGEMAWRGWQVPVINVDRLLNEGGSNSNSITPKSRILVIKTLGESTQVNYIGLVIQGLPRLKKVTAQSLIEKRIDNLPETVFSEVNIDDLQAFIPELGSLTRLVEEAAYDS